MNKSTLLLSTKTCKEVIFPLLGYLTRYSSSEILLLGTKAISSANKY